ncbi:hypothetical protein [Paenibacillus glycinis]|uniref:Uncharacterized protein n=1 Tax=Paenibacillus glycinis TaxID=2697035 RepID=A0ABW9XS88_9BACL|nr:hypothetical protein [Paenibacillus glycinis]NBD25197.1 hypothetical protein [Paenibacillus glycinis]
MMTKAETMDKLIEEKGALGGAEVIAMIRELFGCDLASAPMAPGTPEPLAAIDAFLGERGGRAAGSELRGMINAAFGINLDALSALEGKRISLFSKGQWMLQADDDLFVVYTGDGDVDVKIYPTGYLADLTGSRALPPELAEALTRLGYADEGPAGCTYADPAGQAVPDAFKGQTIMTLMNAIRASYASA